MAPETDDVFIYFAVRRANMALLDEIEVRVYRSYIKIPLIFFVPALTLATLFVLVYFHANSSHAWRMAEDQLHESTDGHYSFEYLEVGPTLTTYNAYGASLSTSDRKPVVAVDEARAVLNPLMLFTGRIEFSELDADGVQVWLELKDGRLNLFEALDRYDRPDSDSDVAVGFSNIHLGDAEFQFVEQRFGFKVDSVDIPWASLDRQDGTTMISLDAARIPKADFWFHPELFRFQPDRGDWEFTVRDFAVDNWRWIGGGFVVDEVVADVEGIGIDAKGRMEFPDTEAGRQMLYDAEGTLSATYESTALEYFTGGNLRFDIPRLDVAVEGDLDDIDGQLDAEANVIELNGMYVEDLSGPLRMQNRFLTSQELTGTFYDGDIKAENVVFSMLDRFYGADLDADGVNPRPLVEDMVGEDHPFLDGELEGGLQLVGEIPRQARPRADHQYALATDLMARFATMEVTDELVFRRNNDLLFPNQQLEMAEGGTFFADQRRMGIPEATVTSGADRVDIRDFYLEYMGLNFETVGGSGLARLWGQFEDFGPYATYYGVDGLEGPAEFSMNMEGYFGSPRWQLTAEMDEPRWRIDDDEVFDGDHLEVKLSTEHGIIGVDEARAYTEMGDFHASGWVEWYQPPPKEPGDDGPIWEDRREQPLELDVGIDGLRLEAVSHLIDPELGAEGPLDADVELRGSMQALRGGFDAGIDEGSVRDQRVERARATGEFEPGGVVVDDATVDLDEAGTMVGSGHYHYDGAFSFDMEAEDIEIGELEEVRQMPTELAGQARFFASGEGTIDEPRLSAGGQVRNLSVNGRTYGDVALAADTIDDVIHVSGGLLPWLTASMEIPLFDEDRFYARFGMEELALMDFLPELEEHPMLDDAQVTGSAELFLERDFSHYQVVFNLADLSIDSRGQRITNREPVVVGYNNGEVVTFDDAQFESGDRSFELGGAVALDPAILDLRVNGELDLALLDSARAGFPEFFPEFFVDADGFAEMDMSIRGTPENFVADGTVWFGPSQWEMRFLPEPVDLERGRMNFGDRGIEIPDDEPMEGTMLGGAARVNGTMGYLPEHPRQMDLEVWSHNMSYRIPDLATLVFDTDLRLEADDWHDWESWLISGDVDILDGVYEQEFNFVEQELAGRVIGAFQPQTEQYEAGLFELFPSLNDIRFDMNVRARDGFYLQSQLDRMEMDLEFRFDVLIQDTLVDPRVTGDFDVLDGEVAFQGESFEVRSGTVRFTEDLHNPYLDIQAGADVRNTCAESEFVDEVSPAMTLSSNINDADMEYYHVMLNIEGELENLDLHMESNPYADQRDILSMLLTGCTVDELTASGASRPTLEVALGPLLGRLEREIQDVVAVDEFTIMPGVERTQVHIGDTLTRRLSWRFQLDTGFTETTGGQQYQLEYRLSDHWTAELSERSQMETENFLLDLKLNYRLPLD